MLLDDFLPRYDVRECHALVVRAGVDRLYASLRQADLGESRLVRLLMALRALPLHLMQRGTFRERLSRPPGRVQGLTIARAGENGFALLAEDPPRELVLGLEGRFWTPAGDLRPTSAAHFRDPPAPGTARAAWNFLVEPLGDGRARLSTETRVLAADPPSRRRVLAYWLVIRPGSGLIRRSMLTTIRRDAEGSGAGSSGAQRPR
jgi:hypothetical protein